MFQIGRPLLFSDVRGDDVVDFGRAAAEKALIAAEITGRTCHAIELLGQYVDVAVERWQAFTGNSACLEGDGRTFAIVSAERRTPAPTP